MLSEGPTDRESEVVGEHFAYLQRLVEEGTVLMAGRTLTTDEHAFGIVVFVAESESAALAVMQNDPAVQHHVMRGELFPYRVALWSSKNPLSVQNGD